jgi:hypothetical protein
MVNIEAIYRKWAKYENYERLYPNPCSWQKSRAAPMLWPPVAKMRNNTKLPASY